MTDSDHAIWQADLAEREKYAETLCLVHLSMNYESEAAHGTYDDTVEMQGEMKCTS